MVYEVRVQEEIDIKLLLSFGDQLIKTHGRFQDGT